jgi:nitroimidazol reductase NimA-like FMN-containing flavoprotein (pyridoxamine 5'-phosphate oxidase superfamily)
VATETRRPSLSTLSRARCEELLAQHELGRVGVAAADGPLILPVNYRFRAGRVVFRTSPYGPLAGLSERTRVAFEVDSIDESGAEGWSVLVRGSATGVTGDHDLARLWASGPQPWAPGSRTLFISIEPTSITGRAVQGS